MDVSHPHNEEPDDQDLPKPRLQLQPVHGGGPGGPGRTAVGAGEYSEGPGRHHFSPTEAPKWFVWIFPVASAVIKCQLRSLTPKSRRQRCEDARLSDDELTVLRMRWDMNLNLEWRISGDGIKHFASTESALERESVWKLWSYNFRDSFTVAPHG